MVDLLSTMQKTLSCIPSNMHTCTHTNLAKDFYLYFKYCEYVYGFVREGAGGGQKSTGTSGSVDTGSCEPPGMDDGI